MPYLYPSTPASLRSGTGTRDPFYRTPGSVALPFEDDEDPILPREPARIALPGMDEEDPIEAAVDDALAAEGFGAPDMTFSLEETAGPEVEMLDFQPGPAPRMTPQRGIMSALASAFPVTAAAASAVPSLARDAFASFRRPPAPAPAAPTTAAVTSSPSTGVPVEAAGALSTPQRAPQPVQAAPSSDKDTARSDKMLGRGTGPNTIGQTQAETDALDAARLRDRRMRIGQGVVTGLGGLLGAIGAGTGNTALAGVGAGIGGIGRTIPAGIAEERARADIERRQNATAADIAAQQRAQQLGTDAERVAVGRIGAEAQRTAAESRARLDVANAERIRVEQELQAGNAEAAREFIRGRIRGAPPGPRRDALAAATAPGSDFDRLQDMATLRDMLDAAEDIDSRGERVANAYRGADRGQWVENADGSATWVPGRGGSQQRAPAHTDPYASLQPQQAPQVPATAPVDADPFGDAIVAPPAPVAPPAAVPARGGAARPRARAAAAPAPVPGPVPGAAPGPAPAPVPVPGGAAPTPPGGGTPIDLSNQGHVSDFEALLDTQGVPRGSESWSLRRNNFIRTIAGPDETARRQAIAEVRAELAQATQSAAAGWAVGVPPAQATRVQREVEPLVTVHRDMAAVINELSRFKRDHPLEYRAAISGRPVPGEGNAEAYGMIRTYFAENKHRLTGAAATDAETQDLMASMGLGTLPALTDPDAFLNLMIRRRDDLFRQIMGRARNIDVRASARFLGSQYPRQRDRIYRSLGYTEPSGGR